MEDGPESEANSSYAVSLRIAWDTAWDPSQKAKQNQTPKKIHQFSVFMPQNQFILS